jgi:hypothetical protein
MKRYRCSPCAFTQSPCKQLGAGRQTREQVCGAAWVVFVWVLLAAGLSAVTVVDGEVVMRAVRRRVLRPAPW